MARMKSKSPIPFGKSKNPKKMPRKATTVKKRASAAKGKGRITIGKVKRSSR